MDSKARAIIRSGLVVVLGCLLARISAAEDLHWTISSLDPYGYVPASDLMPKSPTPAQRTAWADLRAGRSRQAWIAFRDLYRNDDGSPLHIWGLALSARMAGALPEAEDEVASKAGGIRKGEPEPGVSRAPGYATARHIIAFNLVQALMAEQRLHGRLSRQAQLWYSTLLLQPLPSGETRREMILLYSVAMLGINEIGKSRKWLKAYVDSHPKESRGRLLLAQSYSRGVERMVDGHGKELPVPPEDRMDRSLARKYAVEAARLEPNWAEAQYFAGWQFTSSSPETARGYLTRYLQLDKNPPKLRKAVIEQFLRTGRWGPPQPPPG